MKVTKDMIDPELRRYFGPSKLLSFICTRKWGVKLAMALLRFSKGKDIKGLHCEEHYITPSSRGAPSSSADPIRVRVFKPLNAPDNLPAMLYSHGGGYIIGTPEMFLSVIERFIKVRPCVVIVPDYRKALTAPFPAAFDDCYDSLLWAKANAATLGIRSDKFILAGHSAGGGLTAALTLKARDTKDVDIAFQMPIYPMLDDRQTTESARDMDVAGWNTATNAFAWDLYLGGNQQANPDLSPYAAPARNSDYQDFPPTITLVGEFEPFRDETIAYVEALKEAGVTVTYKFYQGCFHGFDLVGTDATIAQDALDFTYDAYAEHYDTYLSH